MKSLIITTAVVALATSGITSAEETKSVEETPLCKQCADAKPDGPATEYEGVEYRFCSAECLAEFNKAREESLYQRLGGKEALDAAVELFYVKVLADDRVNFFFEEINMSTQKRKQKEFLSAALGSPVPWIGDDMREAHKDLDLRESDFAAIAEHLHATLVELGVGKELVGEVMAVVATTKDDVLNR